MPIYYAGDDTLVMEANDTAIVSYLMVFQKQVCEISAPFLIDRICSKILFKLVFKHFVRFPMLVIRILWTHDGMKPLFRAHIFMNGRRSVAVTVPSQIDCHAPVTINAIVFMADFPNLRQNLRFMGIIIRLPVFPVVVISIWINIQPYQQPADSKKIPIFIYKPISL